MNKCENSRVKNRINDTQKLMNKTYDDLFFIHLSEKIQAFSDCFNYGVMKFLFPKTAKNLTIQAFIAGYKENENNS